LNYEVKHLNDKDIDYVLMTNRSIGKKNDNQLKNVMTCFERFDGKDLVSVKRNGLILSTLRRVF